MKKDMYWKPKKNLYEIEVYNFFLVETESLEALLMEDKI